MVRILAERKQFARNSNPNDYDLRRIREMRQERCQGGCNGLFPSSVMQWEDGRRKCPGCFEIRGTTELERIRAVAQAWIAEDVVKGQPWAPVRPAADSPSGTITKMQRADNSDVLFTSPLTLSKGGAAVTLLLTGARFSASDTFSYSTGITDNVAPALTGTTLWTLSLKAANTMAGGEYNLTFNGTTWRGIFRVR